MDIFGAIAGNIFANIQKTFYITKKKREKLLLRRQKSPKIAFCPHFNTFLRLQCAVTTAFSLSLHTECSGVSYARLCPLRPGRWRFASRPEITLTNIILSIIPYMFRRIFQNMPPVTKNLLIINVLVWALCNLVPQFGAHIEHYAALYYWDSPFFQPWQLFTYMFVHIDFMHLFFNMFALLMFGGIIERALGSKRFLFYYVSCGLGAAFIQEGVFAYMAGHYSGLISPSNIAFLRENIESVSATGFVRGTPEQLAFVQTPEAIHYMQLMLTSTIGASGAVYGILLAFGMLFPNMPIYIMFIPVPIKAKWVVIGYGVIEVLSGISSMSGVSADNVAHFAHLGGMLFGIIMLLIWKKKGVINNGFGGY